MGGGWINVPATDESEEAASQQGSQIDVNQTLKDMQQDMRRLGRDTINGIACQRYAIDSEFTLPLPVVEGEAQAIMPTEMTGKIQGEVCIADERDLPRVMVQEQSVYEMTLIYASGAQERSSSSSSPSCSTSTSRSPSSLRNKTAWAKHSCIRSL